MLFVSYLPPFFLGIHPGTKPVILLYQRCSLEGFLAFCISTSQLFFCSTASKLYLLKGFNGSLSSGVSLGRMILETEGRKGMGEGKKSTGH